MIAPDPILFAAEESERAARRPIARVGDARGDVLARARAYLSKVPAAIAGSGGHAQTWAATVALIRGFDLSAEQAYRLLKEEYNPRCDPPWSERELRHKVKSAVEQCRRETGYLVAGGRKKVIR
jgi:hypothetical protein